MRVHDTLEPLRGLRAVRRRAVETGALIGDGGYSRVIALNAYSVLKLTSCSQTRQLLDELSKKACPQHPVGLPAVLETWGVVAKDADGVQFAGYVVERLFTEAETSGRMRAKRLGLTALATRRAIQVRAFQPHLAELGELREQLEAARERCLLGERATYLEHQQMAEQLAVLRLPGGMTETFAYLADFVRRTKAELDLFQRGNILLDCSGRPMLADPVAEQTDDKAALPATSSAPQWALVANSVVALDGLHAVVEWDTVSLSEDQDALQIAGKDMLSCPAATTIETKVLSLGGAEHRQLLTLGRQRVPIWQVPTSARRVAMHRC